jgi:hypothetical protein
MTKIIARPRQAGKTHEAVQWVLAGEQTDSYPNWSRVLLCHSIEESIRIRSSFPELDYRQVFSYEEWRKARLGNKPVEVAVDNADILIERVVGQRASVVTISGETE